MLYQRLKDVKGARAGQKGFTLLELVMVMTIIVILAAVGVSSYQHLQQKAREEVLKKDLKDMRRLIDQYEADKEKLPTSLQDLVSEHYLHEIPVDPMTGEAKWDEIQGESVLSVNGGGSGVIDVKSLAPGEDSEGKPYSEY